MPCLLILTVGTGTSGRYSNLAQGLVNTLRHLQPRGFWLVPSASSDSLAVAEMVRDGAPEPTAFRVWAPACPFRRIERPDDLYDCRTALREVIHAARSQLRSGESLLVNPTSGTKQMSVGAALAALDEEIGEIVFTVGERADGVVKTGTERLAPFSTRRFFLERDLRIAAELFAAGAFFAAARVLEPYPETEAAKAREKTLCLHEWQRMNYARAAAHAARFSEELRLHLQSLAQSDEFGAARLGDLLAGADELARWGDHEEALARYYRGAEQTAKVRLAEDHAIRPPYNLDSILKLLPPGCRLEADLRSRAKRGTLLLTAQVAWDLLDRIRDPIAAAYFANRQLQQGLSCRNDTMYGHGQAKVEPAQTRHVAACLRRLLEEHLPAVAESWIAAPRPRALNAETADERGGTQATTSA